MFLIPFVEQGKGKNLKTGKLSKVRGFFKKSKSQEKNNVYSLLPPVSKYTNECVRMKGYINHCCWCLHSRLGKGDLVRGTFHGVFSLSSLFESVSRAKKYNTCSKNYQDGINNRCNTGEEKLIDLEDKLIPIIQTETQKRVNKNSLNDL